MINHNCSFDSVASSKTRKAVLKEGKNIHTYVDTVLINIDWPIPWNSRIPGTLPFIIETTRTKAQVLTKEDYEA